MTTPNNAPPEPVPQAHEENCPDPTERLGGHATCPEKLTEREARLLVAVSDLHSRVTTLWTWGLNHEEATELLAEAYKMFLKENAVRVMTRRPPRTLPSVEHRHTQVVEEIADKEVKRKGTPPGVGG